MALVTVAQLVEKQPALTHGGVRWDIFNSNKNGLEDSGALIRKGRRIFIDEDRYIDWLRGQSDSNVAQGAA